MSIVRAKCLQCGEILVDPKFAFLEASIGDTTITPSLSCPICGIVNQSWLEDLYKMGLPN